MNKDEIFSLHESLQQFTEQAKAVAIEYASIIKRLRWNTERAELTCWNPNETVEFVWEETHYGCTDQYGLSFPAHYLWEEGWQNALREELAAQAKARELLRQEEERLNNERREQWERNEYERLKRKFERG